MNDDNSQDLWPKFNHTPGQPALPEGFAETAEDIIKISKAMQIMEDNFNNGVTKFWEIPEGDRKQIVDAGFRYKKEREYKIPEKVIPKSYKNVPQKRRQEYRLNRAAKFMKISARDLMEQIAREANDTTHGNPPRGLISVLKSYRLATKDNTAIMSLFDVEEDKGLRRMFLGRFNQVCFKIYPEGFTDKFAYKVYLVKSISDKFIPWSEAEEKAYRSKMYGKGSRKRKS